MKSFIMKKNYSNSNKNWVSKIKTNSFIDNAKTFAFLLTVFFLVSISTSVKAQSGIYESYAILKINGGGNTYYDLQASTGNPDFQGANLGTFYSGNSLILNGGQNKVYVCTPDDITSGNLYYRIYKISDTPPSFTNSIQFLDPVINYPGAACSGTGKNQDWESKTAGINVLGGLTPGTYYLEVYTNADYKVSGVQQGIPHYANNGALNYKSQFTLMANCVTGISVNPATITPVCVGSTAATLTATITTASGSGAANITYEWFSNTSNSTTGGTLVQSTSTTTATSTSSYTPSTGSAGTLWYYCTVTNTDSTCSGSFSTTPVAVVVTSPPVLFFSQTNVLCFGNSTGAINITATGGTGAYTYDWADVAGTSNTEDRTNLPAGAYSVIVTDVNGCSMASLPVTITQPASSVSVALTSQTNVLCIGNSTGAINITASGGTGAYTYDWADVAGTSNSEDRTNLPAGTYSVIVTDANGCATTASATITQPATALAASRTFVNVLCFGNSTGSIDLTVTGGTSPYTYLWSNAATTQDISGLVAGSYNVTITDFNGCTTTASVIITQPSVALASTTSQVNVLCFGNSTGSTDLTVTGGTSPYTYLWSNAATTQDISGLSAGSYNVTITDFNGCTTTASATITQPASAVTVALTSQTNVLCFGNSTGAINITATGGTGAYTYDWADVAGTSNSEDRTNLLAGTYSVIVTDANGCLTALLSVTITQPAALVITATSNSVVCMGNTLNLFGNVTSGGIGTPTYSWVGPLGFNSTLQNPSITNVPMGAAGIYTLTVTNGNGCTTSQTTTVIVNPVPNVSITPTFTSGFVKKNTFSTVLYNFTVTNIGSVSDYFDLSSIQVADPNTVIMDVRFLTMGGTTISATPTIPVSGTYTFQIELSVNGNPPKVYNHTMITATSHLCSISYVSADIYTYEYNGSNPPAPSGAQLEIAVVSSVATAIVGMPFQYTITALNNSNAASATNVIISNQVPANLTITDSDGGVQTGNSISWSIGNLSKISSGTNVVQKTITVVPNCTSVPSVNITANVISSPTDNGLGIPSATLPIPVIDNIAPTAICKPITVILDSTGGATITVAMINNGSYDNCSIQSIAISKSVFNCSNLGPNNVTLTVKDVSGNANTCISVVTIVDNQTPVFTICPTTPAPICADNLTTYTKVGTSWDASATDNCGFSLIYSLTGSTTGTGTSLNGAVFNVGTTTITWAAVDTAGNTTKCIFAVTINPMPTINTQPINQLDCEGSIVSFKVVTSGTGLNYIWQRKRPSDASFVTIPVEANVSYPNSGEIRLQNVGSSLSPDGTQYQVIVSNATCSVTSSAATLSVNEITGVTGGTTVTQCYGTNYSYTVSTSYPANVISYQWKSSVASGVWNDVVNGAHFSGATSATLNIINGMPTESAEYRVYITFHSSGTDCNVTSASRTRNITFLPLLLTPSVTVIQPTCTDPTGTITVTAPIPAVGIIYTVVGISPVVAAVTNTTGVFSGLAAGDYSVTTTNALGCASGSTPVTIQAATTAIWNGLGWTNGPPTINQPLEFTGNFNSIGDLTACSCTVTSGTVIINPTHTLKITNWVHVNGGSLTFENTASLVQINNVSNTNSGNITYKRQTTKISNMDYTYWSTPVLPFSLGGVSPLTLGDKFYSFDASIENWKQESAATTMVPGVGYIIRGPQTYQFPTPPSLYDASFIGVPNNGHYEITGIIADRSYLLGNPYSSALDADMFLIANAGVLEGTLYFWTHNTAIQLATNITNGAAGSGAYAYTSDDYAAYNITGGTGTAAPSSVYPYMGLNSNIPTGKIAAGQGFFGDSKVSLIGFKIVFDNTMRVGVGGITGDNSQFFKTKKPKAKIANTIEKHRIWLDLTNDKGAFKQTLVGYITNATNDYDSLFDGESLDGNKFVDFYSVNQGKNLTIQGRSLPFIDTDEVPLGLKTTIAGDFTINIDQVDGLLMNQAVFIEDKLTNTIFDLKNGNYTFTTKAGTFNERFVLKFTNKTLATANFDVPTNTVLVSNKNKQIKINSFVETIDKVTIYDLLGRQIYQKTNVDSNELSIPNLASSHQALVVKTSLQNGTTVTDKIIF